MHHASSLQASNSKAAGLCHSQLHGYGYSKSETYALHHTSSGMHAYPVTIATKMMAVTKTNTIIPHDSHYYCYILAHSSLLPATKAACWPAGTPLVPG